MSYLQLANYLYPGYLIFFSRQIACTIIGSEQIRFVSSGVINLHRQFICWVQCWVGKI